MTPQEIQAECIAIATSIHPEAYTSASIASDAPAHRAVRACCYPRGVGRSERHDVVAKTFEEAFTALREKLVSVREAHAIKTTRAIALAIIQQTMDFGECTDAALRAEFSAGEVEAYGAAAIEEANKLSENRPFRIVAMRGANAA
jgi:hypothetical protein